MPEIFVYLIKANVALVLFYIGYRLLLRKLTFYNLNRYYLLFALLFSAIYPLVNLSGWVAEQQVAVADVVYVLPDWQGAPEAPNNAWRYVSVLMWGIAGIFGLRLFLRLASLRAIHRTSTPAQWRQFHYRQVLGQTAPFSFWRTIYLDVEQHGTRELEDIFHHEQVHVDQLHTVDILLAEVCTILCWFNPGAWLLRHAVRENLEFITDRRVLQDGVDRAAYQYSLLKAACGSSNSVLTANFNIRSLKRRIAMMNAGRSSRLHLGKYILMMPAIASCMLIFTITNARPDKGILNVVEQSVNDEYTTGGNEGEARVAMAEPFRSLVQQRDSIKAYSLRSAFDGLIIIDGKEASKAQLLKLSSEEIKGIEILKDHMATARYGDKGKHGVILLTTKASPTPPGSADASGKPLIFIDGVAANEGELAKLDNSQIANVDVLKGSAATSRYGEKGNNGVVLITTKSGKISYTADTIVVVSGRALDDSVDDASSPLIFIDGERATVAELRALSPDDIKDMYVLKGETATERYGEEGKNGVVEIVRRKK